MQHPFNSPLFSYDPEHPKWKIDVLPVDQREKPIKIFSKFIGIFTSKQPESSGSSILIGRRIGELDEVAQFVLNELQEVQNDLRKEKENLSTYFETYILNSLVKEGEQLKLEKQYTPSEQVKLFHRYREWIEKARPVIEFFSNKPDDSAIIDLIIRQATESVILVIERDKKVIGEYADQYLNSIEEDKGEFQFRVNEHLREYLEQLDALKHSPSYYSLNEWNNWKEEVDEARLVFFDEALHAIDSFFKKADIHSQELKNYNKKTALDQIIFLEEEIFKFYLKIEKFKDDKNKLEEYRKDLNVLDKFHQALENQRFFSLELEERYEKIEVIFDDLYKIFER